jgi:hypothetical protein
MCSMRPHAKFVHVGLPRDNGARIAQELDDRGIVRTREIPQHGRSGRRRQFSRANVILDGDKSASNGAWYAAAMGGFDAREDRGPGAA